MLAASVRPWLLTGFSGKLLVVTLGINAVVERTGLSPSPCGVRRTRSNGEPSRLSLLGNGNIAEFIRAC